MTKCLPLLIEKIRKSDMFVTQSHTEESWRASERFSLCLPVGRQVSLRLLCASLCNMFQSLY